MKRCAFFPQKPLASDGLHVCFEDTYNTLETTAAQQQQHISMFSPTYHYIYIHKSIIKKGRKNGNSCKKYILFLE